MQFYAHGLKRHKCFTHDWCLTTFDISGLGSLLIGLRLIPFRVGVRRPICVGVLATVGLTRSRSFLLTIGLVLSVSSPLDEN